MAANIVFSSLMGLACLCPVHAEVPSVPMIEQSMIESPGNGCFMDGTGSIYDPYAYNLTGPAFPENANTSVWLLNVTAFRKGHSKEGGYNRSWDLSDLPSYQPFSQPSGELRIWGSNYIKDGSLGGYWADAFNKFQPNIHISYTLPDSGIAVSALSAKVADLGVGRPATLDDLMTYEQVYGHGPVTITAATGSYDVYGWSPAYVIVVSQQNPLTQISMDQLDGVFGAARGGGYNGSIWLTHYPYRRGPEKNIRI